MGGYENHTASQTDPVHGGNSTFSAALLDPEIAVPGTVTDASGRSALKRYSVYRNNVVVSLLEALGAAFPSTRTLMGETNFNKVARNFIASHPPRSAMMQNYGENFAEFLERFPPLAKSPFLGDLARMERGWLDAYHAADMAVLEPSVLSSVDPSCVEDLRFGPHPALCLISSRWPVADLFEWRYGKPEKQIDLDAGQSTLITRPQLEVQVWRIDNSAFRFFELTAAGHALGVAASETGAQFNGFDLTQTLALALNAGVFSSAVLPERR